MVCRNCGTEVAEKALVCFRCGTATAEAVHRGPVLRDRRLTASNWATLIVSDVIGLTGLYLGFTATSQSMRLVGWIIFVVATVLVVAGVMARRR
jgi:hypothetical protein